MRWLLLVALAACAARLPEPSAAPGSSAFQARAFETTPLPEFVRGDAVDDAARAGFAATVAAAGLIPDGRLAALALAIADDSAGASRPPSYPLVSYHARRVGLAEPTPQVWLASGPSVEALRPALERALLDARRGSRLTHAGAAARTIEGGVVMSLALSTRVFTFRQPVPRSAEVGSKVRLDVELARAYRAPTIAVTDPEGRVTRETLGPQSQFVFELPLPRAGEYTLELLATGPEGLTVVAIVPVMVGRALATTAPELDSSPVEADPDAVAAHLMRLIGEERKKRGLPALRHDPRLEAIAARHSRDMVEHGFIAHTSKRTGDATARVQSAGLKARLVLENIGRGYSASELHRGLMESPGHRGNILHPDARQLGIGVVAEREGERDAFIATELFTQLEP